MVMTSAPNAPNTFTHGEVREQASLMSGLQNIDACLHRFAGYLAKLTEIRDKLHGTRPHPVATGGAPPSALDNGLIEALGRRRTMLAEQLNEMETLVTAIEGGLG